MIGTFLPERMMRIETRGRVLFQNLRHIRRIQRDFSGCAVYPCVCQGNVENTHYAALVILRQADLLLGRHLFRPAASVATHVSG